MDISYAIISYLTKVIIFFNNVCFRAGISFETPTVTAFAKMILKIIRIVCTVLGKMCNDIET